MISKSCESPASKKYFLSRRPQNACTVLMSAVYTSASWLFSDSLPAAISLSMAFRSFSRISAAAFSVKVTAKISLTRALPSTTRRISRLIMAKVLPLPAEADTSRSPSS